MTDAELLRFGKDNRYMCSPYAKSGQAAARSVCDSVARGKGRI